MTIPRKTMLLSAICLVAASQQPPKLSSHGATDATELLIRTEPNTIQQFRWNVYKFTDRDNGVTCYITGVPNVQVDAFSNLTAHPAGTSTSISCLQVK